MPVYDPSGYEPGEDKGGAIPPGEYVVTVGDVECTTSKSSGNPMIKIEFDVVEPEKYNTRKLWDYFVTTEDMVWKLGQFCQCADRLAAFDTDAVAEVWAALRGATCRAEVKHEQWDGAPSAKIKRYLPAPDFAQPAPMGKANPDDDIPF